MIKALVVDDSRATRSLVKRVLVELGFEVSEAGDGRAALEQLQAGPTPALALLDWNMPVMDGFELLQQIRGNRGYDGMRVVMVTTEVESQQMARALAAGADEYVMKPFTADVLRCKLDMLQLG